MCKLEKSLYGLKQSPRAWFEKFTCSIKKQGYTQAQTYHTMLIEHSRDGRIIVLIVYVDNLILTSDNQREMDWLKTILVLEFEIKDLEPL